MSINLTIMTYVSLCKFKWVAENNKNNENHFIKKINIMDVLAIHDFLNLKFLMSEALFFLNQIFLDYKHGFKWFESYHRRNVNDSSSVSFGRVYSMSLFTFLLWFTYQFNS